MKSSCCVGGMTEHGKGIRLLSATGSHWAYRTCPFEIGSEYQIEYQRQLDPKFPHTEDVLVTGYRLMRALETASLKSVLMENFRYVGGSPTELFQRMLKRTANGSLFISEPEIPKFSVQFWLPDRELKLRIESDNRSYYTYEGCPGQYNYRIKHVGYASEDAIVPKGALVRVSLARWWQVSHLEPRCYLQMSGWFI